MQNMSGFHLELNWVFSQHFQSSRETEKRVMSVMCQTPWKEEYLWKIYGKPRFKYLLLLPHLTWILQACGLWDHEVSVSPCVHESQCNLLQTLLEVERSGSESKVAVLCQPSLLPALPESMEWLRARSTEKNETFSLVVKVVNYSVLSLLLSQTLLMVQKLITDFSTEKMKQEKNDGYNCSRKFIHTFMNLC